MGAVETFVVARSHSGFLFTLHGPDGKIQNFAEAEPATPSIKHAKLGQWSATSIAGNDLLSSCLYTAGICAGYAGKMAPASLLCVSIMLYFFRYVYGEVVTAMPVNGGSYTALSNTTSKRLAALAAACSVISYIATAVVSAESAVNYLQLLWPAINNQFGTLAGTVVVLATFAALNLLGMSESAVVATGLFVLHFCALVILLVWSAVWGARDEWALLKSNMATPYPQGFNWAGSLYYGYSAALLGITGFETAANYVEEMESSTTYIAVLRNMWISVAIINPLIGLLALAVMPMDEMYNYSANLLGPMAKIVGGENFQTFICVDGFLVLCGSVLTGYVGITGLVRRMALDRILPSFLLTTNSVRGTPHWIILGFFAVCSSLLLALDGDVVMLGSVYNIAFLSVMSAFACSCLVLKVKRPRLPRKVIATYAAVIFALFTVVAGLVGNIVRSPVTLAWFALYYGVVVSVIGFMFSRVEIIFLCSRLVRSCLPTRAEKAARTQLLLALKAAHKRAEKAHAHSQGAPTSSKRSPCAVRARFSSTVGVPGDLQALHALTEGSGSVNISDDDGTDAHASARESARAATGVAKLARGWGAWAGQDSTAHEVEQDEDEMYSEHLLDDGVDGEAEVGAMAEYSADSINAADECVDSLEARTLSYRLRSSLLSSLSACLQAITSLPIVFFAKDANLNVLNKAVRYVLGNEASRVLVLVHVPDDRLAVGAASDKLRVSREVQQGNRAAGTRGLTATEYVETLREELQGALPACPTSTALAKSVEALLATYPKMHITGLVVRGTCFGPGAVKWVARHLSVGPHNMFMAMPDERFAYPFAALGGVRVITRVR